MPVITVDQALEVLTREVQQKLPADEVVEVYNDVFLETPITEERAQTDSGKLTKKLVSYFASGLGVDEIVDLWGIVFPGHRNVWYNEEEDRLYFEEEAEALSSE